MRKTIMLFASLAMLAAASSASGAAAVGPFKLDAKGNCHGLHGVLAPKASCATPPPAATPAPAATTAAASAPPKCVKGKVCGKTCIAMDKVCHKP